MTTTTDLAALTTDAELVERHDRTTEALSRAAGLASFALEEWPAGPTGAARLKLVVALLRDCQADLRETGT